jgi:hypothetical protein
MFTSSDRIWKLAEHRSKCKCIEILDVSPDCFMISSSQITYVLFMKLKRFLVMQLEFVQ